MAKYYLSILYKDARGEITEEHKTKCNQSLNFVCEKNSGRIYYDIPLESILKDKANDLEYIAFFTMEFIDKEALQKHLIIMGLMPQDLINKRMNIYTTYKNERFGLEAGIPYAKTKEYLDSKTIKK